MGSYSGKTQNLCYLDRLHKGKDIYFIVSFNDRPIVQKYLFILKERKNSSFTLVQYFI